MRAGRRADSLFPQLAALAVPGHETRQKRLKKQRNMRIRGQHTDSRSTPTHLSEEGFDDAVDPRPGEHHVQVLGPRLVRGDIRDVHVGLLRASQLHTRSRCRVEQPSPKSPDFRTAFKKKNRHVQGRREDGNVGEEELRLDGVEQSVLTDLERSPGVSTGEAGEGEGCQL